MRTHSLDAYSESYQSGHYTLSTRAKPDAAKCRVEGRSPCKLQDILASLAGLGRLAVRQRTADTAESVTWR
jgi:hypothetical protein